MGFTLSPRRRAALRTARRWQAYRDAQAADPLTPERAQAYVARLRDGELLAIGFGTDEYGRHHRPRLVAAARAEFAHRYTTALGLPFRGRSHSTPRASRRERGVDGCALP